MCDGEGQDIFGAGGEEGGAGFGQGTACGDHIVY